MVFILLAATDEEAGSKLRETLGAQGWWVNLVHDREGALRAAADHEPEVVIIDANVSGATELVRIFSSANGGPGTLVLVDADGELETLALVEAGADEILSSAPRVEELIRAVQRVAAIPHKSGSPGPLLVGRQLTAEEIFGDILSEVDGSGETANGAVRVQAEVNDIEGEEETEESEIVEGSSSAVMTDVAVEEPNAGSGQLARATEVDVEVRGSSVGTGGQSLDGAAELAPVGSSRTADEAGDDARIVPEEEASSSWQGEIEVAGSDEPGTAGSLWAADEPSADAGVAPEEEASSFWENELEGAGSAGTGTAGSLWATAGTNDEAGVAQEGEASSFWRGEFDPALPSVSERSWPSVEADVVAGAEAGDSAETSESFLVEANVEVDAGSESGGGDISSKDLEGDSASEFGQYHLEERIAVGGMAEVWRASMVGMEGFQKTVAIKKILPHLAENKEFVTMFVDEAKLAAQLNHENLVDIYDLGKIGSDFFIAMEYVDGKDLRSILNRLRRRQEQFPLGLAVFIAARTAAALEYAHTRRDADERPLGLVHRDVSPRNILISHNGNIRLCDFGVAKAVSSVTQTEIGALKGKIQYMSPEQAAGARVDARSDLYSLGNVLFEMVTGRALFVQDTEISLLDAVRGGEVDEPREIRADLPDEVNAILLRALQKDPSDRYASAGEMQRELEEALFHLDPKPTHGALAEWLQMLFESAPQPSARVVVDEEVSSSGTQPTAASIEAPPAGEIPREGGSEVTAPAVSTEVTLADRFRALMPRPTGRARFWLGVACGLLLALLAALAVNAWLNRGAVGAEDTTPVVVPQRLEDSLTDGNEADERDEKAMTEPPITGSDQ